MIYRKYRESDARQVWDLHNAALHDIGAHGGNGPWDEDLHNIPDAYLGNRGEFLVCEEEGRIVGMGGLRKVDEKTAEIKRMRVSKETRRQGIATWILNTLETVAVELGYREIILDTTTVQRASRIFYEKNSYVKYKTSKFKEFKVVHYRKTIGE